MPSQTSQTAPDCFDILSTENFKELQDELCKRGVMESYQQRHQRQIPAAPASLHTPALSSPPVNGNCTMVAAQVYVKSIIEKLAKDTAQHERLVRNFVNVKFALLMQLRVLFNWAFRMMSILHGDSTLETHKDIAHVYHSKVVAYRGSMFLDARGFICMKALVIVDDLIDHLSCKEGILEHLGVMYYFTGRQLLRMAHDHHSQYPSLLVTLCQRVDDKLTEEMSTNNCQLPDIIELLDESLWRSIIQLQQRSLVLGVQELRTRCLEEMEATWACYRNLQQEDINIFGVLWEWMAGRKLHLDLGIGETLYPVPIP